MRVARLEQAYRATQALGLDVLCDGARAQEDDGDRMRPRVSPEALDCLPAAHNRHFDVHDDDVGHVLDRDLNCLGAVFGEPQGSVIWS
jgi:hypothetical protein